MASTYLGKPPLISKKGFIESFTLVYISLDSSAVVYTRLLTRLHSLTFVYACLVTRLHSSTLVYTRLMTRLCF